MKSMTCRQLGGACDQEFRAETFEVMAELSKNHGMEMFRKGDQAHLEAMQEMKALANSPEAMRQWYAEKEQLFKDLPSV